MSRLAAAADAPPPSGNLLEWLFAPDGLRPLVVNWSAVGPFLLDRVRQESVTHPDLDELAARLEALAPDAAIAPQIKEHEVVVPLQLIVEGREVRMFSILAGFGSALDAEVADLRIEYFFPEDETTRAWLLDGSRFGAAFSGSRRACAAPHPG